MQVSSTNSLTWLKAASGAASQTSSASPAGGQDPLDASGAEGASPSSVLASLQSPSQLFSAGGLSALISAQLGQSATDPTSSAADPSSADRSRGPARSTQSDLTQGQSTGAVHHHHRRHGGGEVVDPSTPQSTGSASTATSTPASAAGAGASSSAFDVDAETVMSRLLAGL